MDLDRNQKPVMDAVNDAIGALSELFHSVRAHARAAAVDVKASAHDVQRSAARAGRGAVRNGKRAVGKAEAAGDGLLHRATKAWHDLAGTEKVAPSTRRAPTVQRASKPKNARR